MRQPSKLRAEPGYVAHYYVLEQRTERVVAKYSLKTTEYPYPATEAKRLMNAEEFHYPDYLLLLQVGEQYIGRP